MMNVVHPWLLAAGAALVALPLAIHLLTRPKPVRLPFSAMRFLEGALKQRRFFSRLRDVLVLALRALLLAALAAAFARPLIQGAFADGRAAAARRVVILDVSNSMAATKGGVGVFQAAQARALHHLRNAPGLRANLILAGARPEAAFDQFSANFPALQAQARQARALPEELDARAALARAATLLSEAGGETGPAEIVIVTDLQQSNWDKLASADVPAGAAIIVENVGMGPQAGNLAVTRVAPEGRVESGRPTRVRVRVGNFSASEQMRALELSVAERTYRQEITIPAGGAAEAAFDLPGDAAAQGWLAGTARIIEARDALRTDDERPFAFQARRAPRFLLLTADSPAQVGAAGYFAARILGSAGGQHVAVQRPDRLTAEDMVQADAVVLCRPGRLDEAAVRLLAGELLRGRPALYLMGSPADAQNLAALGRACGHAMRLPVRFAAWQGSDARAYRADSAPEARLHLSHVRADAGPFHSFGTDAAALSRMIGARDVLRTAPEPEGLADEILAQWSDGSAALVVTPVGAGRLALWNADILSSGLVRNAFFVALLREAAGRLLLDPAALSEPLPCGLPRGVPLPAAVGRGGQMALAGPAGAPAEIPDVREDAQGRLWRWARVGPPGIYRLTEDGSPLCTVAAACPATESDLRPLDAEQFRASLCAEPGPDGLARTVTVIGAGEREKRDNVETWPWILVGAILVGVLELGVLKAFRA